MERGDPDEVFERQAREGYVWQVHAMRTLQLLGFKVETDPLRIRPRLEEFRDYSDSEDLRITAPSTGRCVRVGVKSRKCAFTGPGDYPWPKCITDTVYSIDRQPRMAAIILVSRASAGWAVVPMTTRQYWKTDVFPTDDGPKLCYWVKRARCRTLESFTDWLRDT